VVPFALFCAALQVQAAPPAKPQTPPAAQADDSNAKPPVSGGTPTITDPAELSAPGWLEFDPGSFKDLDPSAGFGTPFTFKYTALNRRLQYLLGQDGLVVQRGSLKGVGDTYAGAHYLFRTQEHGGYDVALKGLLKIPTASDSAGGTGKSDYSAFLLVSRDLTKWGFHGDVNVGISSIGNAAMAGYSTQSMAALSTTTPLPGGRWQYTNEVVYFSALPGQYARVTTMHGFAYLAHTYEVYSLAVQVRLEGDIPRYQLLLAASFNIAKF